LGWYYQKGYLEGTFNLDFRWQRRWDIEWRDERRK
jgi:hypothetical protein